MVDSVNNNYKIEEFSDLGEIFKAFFNKNSEIKDNDINNIFLNCKLKRKERRCGCKKLITYRIVDEKNNEVLRSVIVNIPKNISTGQKIVVSNCGNYIREKDCYSKVVVTII